MESLQVTEIPLRYSPHTGQMLFHRSEARFRIVCTGRKWGKTTMLVHEAFRWLGKPNSIVWWVAPYYSIAQLGWRRFVEAIPKAAIKRLNKRDFMIEMINGSTLWFKSADSPDSLVGEGIDLIIIDEAARVRERVWLESLRPNLSDPGRTGHMCMASTPRGHNWFYQEWLKGVTGVPEYESWGIPVVEIPVTKEKIIDVRGGFPSWSNPYFKMRELESALRLPQRVFMQEFAGRFLEDLGAVFQNIVQAITGSLEAPVPGEEYYVGVDLGKVQDYTVAIVTNSVGHVVSFDRFRKKSWTRQVEDIIRIAREYNDATIFIDSCYDSETEVLTDNGWKLFEDVDIEKDNIATLNQDTHHLEYQKATRKIKQPYKGEMYHLKTRTVDLLVTPNHHLYVSRDIKKPRKYVREQALKLYRQRFWMKRDAKWMGEEREYFNLPAVTIRRGPSGFVKKPHVYKTIPARQIPMDLWLAFFGWWIAEGCTIHMKNYPDENIVDVRQENPEHRAEIVQIFKEMGYNPRRGKTDRVQVADIQLHRYLSQFGKSHDKHIPREILQLSSRQLKILLDHYMKGDGAQSGVHKGKVAQTVSPQLRDNLMEIALKTGISANYSSYTKKGDKSYLKIEDRWITANYDSYTVRLVHKQNEPVKYNPNGITEEWTSYDDYVWCLEVPNHVMYVRRRGKPVWCGNTGLGDPIYDFIRVRYPHISSVKISGKSKVELIENLAISIQSGHFTYPDIPELIEELSLFGVEQTASGIVRYEAPCFLPGTPVETDVGFRPIEMLVASDRVMTHTGNMRSIKATHDKDYSGQMITLKIRGQFDRIRCTPNHPFYVSKKNRSLEQKRSQRKLSPLKFISASKLKKGDLVFLPKRVGLKEQQYPDDLLYAFGFYLAGGSIHVDEKWGSKSLSIQQKDRGLLEKVALIFEKHYLKPDEVKCKGYTTKNGTIVEPYTRKTFDRPQFSLKKHGSRDIWTYVNYNQKLCGMIEMLFGEHAKSRTKDIGPLLYNMKNLLPLVIGWLDGDGNQRKTKHYDVNGATFSENLAYKMRRILLDSGVYCTIGRNYIERAGCYQYYINIKNGQLKKINIPHSFKLYDLRRVEHHVKVDGGYLVPIQSIETGEYDGKIYDLTVDEDETYNACGVAVHNSGFHDDCVIAAALAAWANVKVSAKKISFEWVDI